MFSATLPSFETVFYGLSPDLLTGTLKHFIRGNYSVNEQYRNTSLIFNSFVLHKQLPKFLQFLSKREILECASTQTSMFRRNSVQSKMIKYYTDLELKELTQTCITPIIEDFTKKNVVICLHNDKENSHQFQESMSILKAILQNIFTKLLSTKAISESFKSFLNYVVNEVQQLSPGLELLCLKNIIFLRCISNCIISEHSNEDITQSLKTISVVLQWVIGDSQITSNRNSSDGEQTASSWKDYFSSTAALYRPLINEWLLSLSTNVPLDKVKFKFASTIKETIQLEEMVYRESDSICEYLEPTAATLLICLKEKRLYDPIAQYTSLFAQLQNHIANNTVTRIKLLTEISILTENNAKLEEKLKRLKESSSSSSPVKTNISHLTCSSASPSIPSTFLTEEKKVGKRRCLSTKKKDEK
ncbi:Ras-GAP domain-containing protein [Entamoeba marina]